MIDGTEKPKIPSNNKIFGERLFPLVRFVQNFFTAGFETGQPRHLSKQFSA